MGTLARNGLNIIMETNALPKQQKQRHNKFTIQSKIIQSSANKNALAFITVQSPSKLIDMLDVQTVNP